MRLASPVRTFLDARRLSGHDGDRSAFAFIGLPMGSPYDTRGVNSPAAGAPDHVRDLSWEQEYAWEIQHHDFDLDGPAMPSGERPDLVDYGDVVGDPRDLDGSKRFATGVVRAALERGAMPLVVGGDDSIPPIVVRAYEGLGALNVLHIDAHIDFRDEVGGVGDGYSSPIRRLRELPWVGRIVQVGIRGVGSARPREVREALQAGNTIIKADDVHDRGVPWVIEQLSWDAPWFVTIDVDGFDPSVTPGTGYPLPGGLSYRQGAAIVQAIAGRGLLAGMDVTEIYPGLDLRNLTALTVTRLIVTAMGASVRAAGREDSVLPLGLAAARAD
jgi:agmatinase